MSKSQTFNFALNMQILEEILSIFANFDNGETIMFKF